MSRPSLLSSNSYFLSIGTARDRVMTERAEMPIQSSKISKIGNSKADTTRHIMKPKFNNKSYSRKSRLSPYSIICSRRSKERKLDEMQKKQSLPVHNNKKVKMKRKASFKSPLSNVMSKHNRKKSATRKPSD